eukprot:785918-Prorocentrum_minimum.AAC.1
MHACVAAGTSPARCGATHRSPNATHGQDPVCRSKKSFVKKKCFPIPFADNINTNAPLVQTTKPSFAPLLKHFQNTIRTHLAWPVPAAPSPRLVSDTATSEAEMGAKGRKKASPVSSVEGAACNSVAKRNASACMARGNTTCRRGGGGGEGSHIR